MLESFSRPTLPDPSLELEILKTYQLTYEFRRECHYREQFQEYCAWYYQTAAQHRQELEQMRHDINLLQWFSRARKN